MKYIASLRVGQNDIKALINIEEPRREQFAPLLNMRGKDDKYLTQFLAGWGEFPFLMDVSRLPADTAENFILSHDLHNPKNGFSNKRDFYKEASSANKQMIPVISWADTDPQRDVVQCALQLSRDFEIIALRVACTPAPSAASWLRIRAILDAIANPRSALIILDFGTTWPAVIADGSPFHQCLVELDSYFPRAICLLSSSFPSDKPASNTSRMVTCHDVLWQSVARTTALKTDVLYGDYAATNPSAPMEYIPGMPVLPFANYYAPIEWWQRRKGGDKEFSNYVEIASEIRMLPGYHGDDFCWATREFARISTTATNYGNNGTWNGYRMNQHICAMLEQLTLEPSEDDRYDIEDLI